MNDQDRPGENPTAGDDAPANWTVDPETGRSNASPAFREASEAVRLILRNERHTFDTGSLGRVADLIVAELAHGNLRLAPPGEHGVRILTVEEAGEERIGGKLVYQGQEFIFTAVEVEDPTWPTYPRHAQAEDTPPPD